MEFAHPNETDVCQRGREVPVFPEQPPQGADLTMNVTIADQQPAFDDREVWREKPLNAGPREEPAVLVHGMAKPLAITTPSV